MTNIEITLKYLELQLKEINDKVDKLFEMHKPITSDPILPYKADSVPQTQACNIMEI